jgi:FeS assembly SUF system regulator
MAAIAKNMNGRLGRRRRESVQFRSALNSGRCPMLRVTKLTDYATVVLTVLAARPGEVLSATELAEQSGLEPPTVSKLLKPLAQAGLVEGLRGVHGGYRLARPADAITLIQIVEAMEGPLAITECSHQESQCSIAQKCGVRSNWRLINDVVADALRGVTLAQMLHPLPSSGETRRRPIAVRFATT